MIGPFLLDLEPMTDGCNPGPEPKKTREKITKQIQELQDELAGMEGLEPGHAYLYSSREYLSETYIYDADGGFFSLRNKKYYAPGSPDHPEIEKKAKDGVDLGYAENAYITTEHLVNLLCFRAGTRSYNAIMDFVYGVHERSMPESQLKEIAQQFIDLVYEYVGGSLWQRLAYETMLPGERNAAIKMLDEDGMELDEICKEMGLCHNRLAWLSTHEYIKECHWYNEK